VSTQCGPFTQVLTSVAGNGRSATSFLLTAVILQKGDDMSCDSFNGASGGVIGFEKNEICEVNGDADWTIIGLGQDLVIRDRVDGGHGTLTLNKFGNITIQEKNGGRTLVVESDVASVTINKVDGTGETHLRNSGFKRIVSKNGAGNVFFRGDVVFVDSANGTGKVLAEQ
jgi:hypothetical protein